MGNSGRADELGGADVEEVCGGIGRGVDVVFVVGVELIEEVVNEVGGEGKSGNGDEEELDL